MLGGNVPAVYGLGEKDEVSWEGANISIFPIRLLEEVAGKSLLFFSNTLLSDTLTSK